ncbi:MAG: DUF115 domain-containing protein [Treponema sp.]|jgi:hypothetical protein|nr:DUF115 domain-containing protein [Treponema sp.]
MTNPFWESNSKILIKQYPGLIEELTREGDDNLAPEEIKIDVAASGEPSLSIKNNYIHSPRDPAREGRRLAETVEKGNAPVIVLGFGLGYAAQAAAELGRPVIIVERYRNLLVRAMELRDFSSLLSKKNIVFVPGGSPDAIAGALSLFDDAGDDKSPSVIRNRALIDIDKDWYGAVEERIRTWKMKDEVNMATLKRFGRRWVRNLSHNMRAICEYPGISGLAGIAGKADIANIAADSEPLPVFLAAAGPSLDRTAPMLREIQRRCIVVAVDTSLRFFIENGIEPDFVLVVDPQFWNSRHLDRCVSQRTRLIAESAVYPPVLRLPFKNIYLCGSLFPLGSFIENKVDPKGKLGAGGSVATTAWDFARTLGGGEIWIAGLDLSFPGLKTHFRGAHFENLSNSRSNRFSPAETWVVRALRDGLPFNAPSADGGQVLTDRRLSLYAAWFQNRFRQHAETRSYSLFQDGIAIAGLEYKKPEDLLALPDRRDEIDKRLEAAFSKIETGFFDPQETRKRAERYENAVFVLTRGLKSIKTNAEKGADVSGQALKRGANPEQQKNILKELDGITRRITESEVKEVAGFLFPPIEEEKTESDPFRAYLKSSFKLFTSLAEAAGYNLDKLA